MTSLIRKFVESQDKRIEKGEEQMGKMSQCERVLAYIRENGSISDNDAHYDLGINRLSGRIFDLRKQGYPIVMEWKKSKNRYGEMTRYGVYTLGKE